MTGSCWRDATPLRHVSHEDPVAQLLEPLARGLAPSGEWLARYAPSGDLAQAWSACRDPRLLFILTEPLCPRRALVRAAVACARSALASVPALEPTAFPLLAAVERWSLGESGLHEVEAAFRRARAAKPRDRHAHRALELTAELVIRLDFGLATQIAETAAAAHACLVTEDEETPAWTEAFGRHLAALADVARMHLPCPSLAIVLQLAAPDEGSARTRIISNDPRHRSGVIVERLADPDDAFAWRITSAPPRSEDDLGRCCEALVRIGFVSDRWMDAWAAHWPRAWADCNDARLLLWMALLLGKRRQVVLAGADCLRRMIDESRESMPALLALVEVVTRWGDERAGSDEVADAVSVIEEILQMDDFDGTHDFATYVDGDAFGWTSPQARLIRAVLVLSALTESDMGDEVDLLAEHLARGSTRAKHRGSNISPALTEPSYRDCLARLADVVRRRIPSLIGT